MLNLGLRSKTNPFQKASSPALAFNSLALKGLREDIGSIGARIDK
jgi:hypothetical protein